MIHGGDNAALLLVLIEAGANVNARGWKGKGPLHLAAREGAVECAVLLLKAGAAVNVESTHGHTPLSISLRNNPRCSRIRPILLRAGANLPAETNDPYIQKVINAGGWANYERQHLDRLTLMLTPKDDGRRRSRPSPLRRVPPEVIRRIVTYAFHAGYY